MMPVCGRHRRHPWLVVACALLAACGSQTKPLTPISEALLDLYADHDLVCLGEEHGHRGDAELREALVRHPGFSTTVDRVLVEFVNPRHQRVVDQLVLEGENVPRNDLRVAWLDAGLGHFWEVSHYERFLRLMAKVNRDLPPEERIPVLGIAPPIPWDSVTGPEDLGPYLDRQTHYADQVSAAVLQPQLKGLAILGAGHCERSGMGLVTRLSAGESRRVASVRSIPGPKREKARDLGLPLEGSPRWIPIRGESRGNWIAGDLFFEGHAVSVVTLGDLFDALVDLGSAPQVIDWPDRSSLSLDWRQELERRGRLLQAARPSGELNPGELNPGEPTPAPPSSSRN